MKFKPENYGISSDYKHWVGDKTEDYIGPFFFLIDGSTPRTAFRIQEHNLNAHDSVHGGVLMAFADYTLCMGANMGQSESVVTMTCNNEFVAPAYKNDIIEEECEIVRRGKSTVFCRCTLRVSGNVVLTGSAVIKRVKNR